MKIGLVYELQEANGAEEHRMPPDAAALASTDEVDHVGTIFEGLGYQVEDIDTRSIRGLGVFAGRDFRKGEVVVHATGKVIPFQTEYSIQIDWDRHLNVDSPVRQMNHSCDPNLGVKTNVNGFPRFVALRDIKQEEELTWDYAMTEYTHYKRDNPESEFDLSCHCGAPNCRGKLGYYSELPEEIKQKYAGFVSDYLLTK